ncbi:Iron-dependent repressor IdeR [Actinomyces bovis]|uniref:Manganese transport regulator n=1 Tax=Actinomyces bovis TaxID=1658 RepID=A0ABY1VNW7_9ACTO|nr:metal-dependent transcriptional regulator [Actinomyces bovis]SPT53437.1 Iron-dependent repressor IdeR [Actinomyces bovis]VEG52899.1 Iron-dependent repressor IdeR [Actinomyces israelii]
MAHGPLSASNEEYLKSIWTLQEWSGAPTTPGDLARRTGMRPSTVSDALRRLHAAGLIERAPYGSVTLTAEGAEQAVMLVRRHRLIELFLVRTLGYTWDEVHDEADALEHTVSPLMVERMDTALGHPLTDPHGDPIPDPDGTITHPTLIPLARARAGERLRVGRVSDRDPGLLRRLSEAGVTLGSHVTLHPSSPFDDVAVVSAAEDGGRELRLSRLECESVLVSPEPATSS